MNKHIGLVERRIIKGEEIPHEEKMFSIFELHTEWITKGKSRPNIELGKKVNITTDQWNFIVDYRIMNKTEILLLVWLTLVYQNSMFVPGVLIKVIGIRRFGICYVLKFRMLLCSN